MAAGTTIRILACGFLAVLAFPAQAQDILIGQVSSQTSPVTAANAKQLYAGINAYFEYVNAKGGVDGRKVKLVNNDEVSYTTKERKGWGGVDLTVIGPNGKLLR